MYLKDEKFIREGKRGLLSQSDGDLGRFPSVTVVCIWKPTMTSRATVGNDLYSFMHILCNLVV